MSPIKNCAAVFVSLMLLSASSFAWGPEGHRIIGEIAETRLTPAARLQVKELLGNDNLAAVALWADEIRSERPESYGWHFVVIPMDASGFSEQRDCFRPDEKHPYTLEDHHNCVVDRITMFERVLADRKAPLCVIPEPDRPWLTFGSIWAELGDTQRVRIAPGPPDRTAWVDVH